MALNELNFSLKVENAKSIFKDWYHFGVVGSGDMEVLMEKKNLDGEVKVKVITPVRGYDKVWQMVITKFIKDNSLGNVYIEINDNNSTPIVVSMRLRQALSEANKGADKDA